jgi:hypothetical protein
MWIPARVMMSRLGLKTILSGQGNRSCQSACQTRHMLTSYRTILPTATIPLRLNFGATAVELYSSPRGLLLTDQRKAC